METITTLDHFCSKPRLCKGTVIQTLPSGTAIIREWMLGNKVFGSEQEALDFAAKVGIIIVES